MFDKISREFFWDFRDLLYAKAFSFGYIMSYLGNISPLVDIGGHCSVITSYCVSTKV